jgi:hypothetical protein
MIICCYVEEVPARWANTMAWMALNRCIHCFLVFPGTAAAILSHRWSSRATVFNARSNAACCSAFHSSPPLEISLVAAGVGVVVPAATGVVATGFFAAAVAARVFFAENADDDCAADDESFADVDEPMNDDRPIFFVAALDDDDDDSDDEGDAAGVDSFADVGGDDVSMDDDDVGAATAADADGITSLWLATSLGNFFLSI